MRRSYERAIDESLFSQIKPMESFRAAAAARSFVTLPKTVYLETEIVPIAMFQRFKKYFPFENVKPVDAQISAVRAVKSPRSCIIMDVDTLEVLSIKVTKHEPRDEYDILIFKWQEAQLPEPSYARVSKTMV